MSVFFVRPRGSLPATRTECAAGSETKTLSAPWLSPLLLLPWSSSPLKTQPAFERRRGAGGRPQSAAAPGPGAPLVFGPAGDPLSLSRSLTLAISPAAAGFRLPYRRIRSASVRRSCSRAACRTWGRRGGGRRGGVNLAGGPPPPPLCPLLSPAVTRPTRPSWRLISAKGGAGWEGGSVHGRRRLPSVFRCFSACSPRRQSPLRPSPVSL